MTLINRQWLLARRPTGAISVDDFAYREVEMAEPVLKPGEILLKSKLFRFAPAMRTWLKATAQFTAPMPLGEPMLSRAAAEVVASANPDFPVGTVVSTNVGWQDYAVIDPAALAFPLRRKPDDMSLLDFEGVFGGNSLTAYFGLLRVGEPKPGETVVVSGAAGSTGAIAAQIARIKGCRVIGIAGGRDKCDWLLNEAKLDGAIDYKSEDIDARLSELCPKGVDVYFDNVGGETLNILIEHMALFGRVALCGQISSYDDGDALAAGPRNMLRVIYWRMKLQGFISADYHAEQDVGLKDLAQWAAEGRLAHHEQVHDGFDQLPRTFLRLFDGTSFGTLLLRTGN